MPAAGSAARLFAGPLDAAMARFDIIDKARRAGMFLANVAHESGQLLCVEERLNYSAAALHGAWPSRFPPAVAAEYAHKPERIANRAYCDRMGNGNEASGDGYRFRGRGPMQVTGRENYRAVGHGIGYDLEKNPDLLFQPEVGALAAAFFWHNNNLNVIADKGDFDGVCDVINRGHKTPANGDSNGFADRLKFYEKAKAVLRPNCEPGESF